jgi:hypothetical protein
LPTEELSSFEQWLPTGQVDQKREDALAMLAIMRERVAAGFSPKRVSYALENTHIWHVASSMPGALESSADGATVLPTTLREEMQIEASYRRVAQGALVRFLATTEASRQNILLSPEQLQQSGDRWRDKRDLADRQRFQRWLAEHDLTIETFSRMLKEEALLQLTRSWGVPDVESRIVDELLMSGEYDRLAARATRANADSKTKCVLDAQSCASIATWPIRPPRRRMSRPQICPSGEDGRDCITQATSRSKSLNLL